jgi:hypothetical protein
MTHLIRTSILTPTILICLISHTTNAQYLQQGGKIVGADAVGSAYQGHSVSISGDGNTVMVGGYADNSATGAVWAYTRSGGAWFQQGSKLVGTGAFDPARQGVCVSLSGDGNAAIVGGYNDNGGVGAIWIFQRSGDVWTQQGSKLIGSGASGNAFQGVAVAISADGNTAIAGGFYDATNRGAAWVYTQSSGVWTQQGTKLVGSDDAGAALQGQCVALSGDGNTAAVSGSGDSSGLGATWVYTRSGGVWSHQGSKLVGTDGVGPAQQGVSVSLSADGNTLIVGGYMDNGGAGAAWVFTRSDGIWTQQGGKLVGTGAMGSARQGRAVSLSADGNTAMVGGSADGGGKGAVWVFKRNAGVWTQQGSKLVGAGGDANSAQGTSLGISGDASTFIQGAEYDNANTGAAWVFSSTQTTFGIISIVDIPNDQGKQVRIKWKKSPQDTTGAFSQITSYSIWRKSSSGVERNMPKELLSADLTMDTTLLNYDYVMSVPAIQLPQYQTVVPTLEDSTAGGTHRFIFRVAAHTADPGEYFVSPPDSGYSVDNLAPATPSGLTASQVITQGGGIVLLNWAPKVDHDFNYFAVYRGSTAGFDPRGTQPIATVVREEYADTNVVKGSSYYYKVSAFDFAGNESGYSIEANIIVAGVKENNRMPDHYTLGQNFPNPFNPSTVIEYALPARGYVTLKIFNMLGVEVATLVEEEQSPGYRSVVFNPTGLAGGVYVYRLTAEHFIDSKKMLLIK